MRIYELRRNERIIELINAFKEALINGEVIDKNKILIGLMFKYSLSKKTASEYYEVAMFEASK